MENFNNIVSELKKNNVTLVAVSKTKPNEQILELYNQEQRIFGENRVQELLSKYEVLPKDIEWHFIGHLQTNKVKFIAPFVSMIHSIHSEKLLAQVDKHALSNNRKIKVLLQLFVAQETTKSGFLPNECIDLIENGAIEKYPNVEICGVMGMATFTDDTEQITKEFSTIKSTFDHLKNEYFRENNTFRHISMGMSGDYKVAIENGSNMVRIGSLLFGSRK